MNFVFSFEFWITTGIVLIFLEFFAPGLISLFIGLGAITVALGMHYGQVSSVFSQIVTWMLSSLFYLFTLRLLVLKFYPQDSFKSEVDEDKNLLGTPVPVVEAIPENGEGRIRFSNSTWRARSADASAIAKGEIALIQGRENITYIVKKREIKEKNKTC